MPNKSKTILTLCLFLSGLAIIQTSTTVHAISAEKSNNISQNRQQLIENKKAEIKQKIITLKEERTTKLETKRLELCKKREKNINTINSKNIEQNTKQITNFHKIEENTKKFYTNKDLFSEEYSNAILNAETKYTEAVATAEASSETSFSCETTDGTNPGSTIIETTNTRHIAIKEYKTAVKNLILVVKKANSANNVENQSINTKEEQ